MTPPEAIAHDKLLQAFGDRPFRREEALAVVKEEHLSALVTAGMIDLQFRLKYAREFLELEAELLAQSEKEEQEGSPALASAKAARLHFPLLRHGRETLQLCGRT